jgi:hypothetical protein
MRIVQDAPARSRSALGFHDLAFAIVTALAANVMWTALFAAVGAFVMAGRVKLVVRPAHVTPRRRSFSFRDRHGGKAPSKTNTESAIWHATAAHPTIPTGAAK